MGGDCQRTKCFEQDKVEDAIECVLLLRPEDASQENVLSEKDQQPGEDGADNTTDVVDEPNAITTAIMVVLHRVDGCHVWAAGLLVGSVVE